MCYTCRKTVKQGRLLLLSMCLVVTPGISGMWQRTPRDMHQIGTTPWKILKTQGLLAWKFSGAQRPPESKGWCIEYLRTIALTQCQGRGVAQGGEMCRGKLCLSILCAISPIAFKDCNRQRFPWGGAVSAQSGRLSRRLAKYMFAG